MVSPQPIADPNANRMRPRVATAAPTDALPDQQQTLRRAARVTGRGYYTGDEVTVELRPAPAGSGIVFVREDCRPHVRIPARIDYRVDDMRRTSLARGNIRVEMIEHAMASLAALGIDNCELAIDRPELPAGDGSALDFVEAIHSAGVHRQRARAETCVIREPIRVEHGDAWLEAAPHPQGRWELHYQLDYSQTPAIGSQSLSVVVGPRRFACEIAPARSFLLEQEAQWLRSQGLGRHVTPQEILVFGQDGPIDNELRFDDECVRHKLLDLIGDLSLCGRRLSGRFRAARSGHQLNGALTVQIAQCCREMPQRCSA